MAKLVADTPLELEFEALCKKHSKKLNDTWAELKALSDSTGVPFGSYLPEKFKDRFGRGTLDSRLVAQLTGIDMEGEYWYSSSARC